MMQFHAVLIRILAADSVKFFLPRPLFERATVKAVIARRNDDVQLLIRD